MSACGTAAAPSTPTPPAAVRYTPIPTTTPEPTPTPASVSGKVVLNKAGGISSGAFVTFVLAETNPCAAMPDIPHGRTFPLKGDDRYQGLVAPGTYLVAVYDKGGPQTAIGGGFFVGPTYWYNNKPCASADKLTLTAGQVLSLDLTFN
jgi:hypothetical protein